MKNPPRHSSGVPVIGVIDGDTVVLEGKSRVRLRFIDAPEKGLCGYEEATKLLEKLVIGKSVRIEETIPDQYGRGMALVYVGNTLVNKEMLKSGWVRFHHDNSSVTEELKAVTDIAQKEGKGVYTACQSQDVPDNPTCVIKGNIDKNSTSRNYYLPTCAQYKFTIVEKDIGENWFCTEAEARKAGFTKAKTCK
ncbi:MAG: thermonuclease family protein [Patescibacteria group bacterium]